MGIEAKSMFVYRFLKLIFVLKNKKNMKNTKKYVWLFFCFEKCKEHKKTLNSDKNNSVKKNTKIVISAFSKPVVKNSFKKHETIRP